MFYKLTHPVYENDLQDARKANPVTIKYVYRIPSIICEVCGTWASGGSRIRKVLPDTILTPFNGITFLQRLEWQKKRAKWAETLEVSEEEIRPATKLGLPDIELFYPVTTDFIHALGQVFVTDDLASLLKEQKFRGLDFFPFEPVWSKKMKVQKGDPPRLWELVITGKAWRVGVTPESLLLCGLCDRKGFPQTRMLIDRDRWDESDFFNIDENPNIVIVTQKVADFFEKQGFSNYKLEPLPTA